ncbi:MAG: hypothetical protein FJ403_11750 [Verrucomicrobia bacterium]|nr:hypothetical protein [Verrucomicrobiota bacterium]
MTKSKIAFALGVLLLSLAPKLDAADPVYENFGINREIPQVDAATFINHGLFSVSTVLPYDTQNTLNFHNLGIMTGNPGFRFDFVRSDGIRGPAANFLNDLDARVFATSGAFFLPGTSVTNTGQTFENSQIIVWATNIYNRGQLHSDARGLVRLRGDKMDLTRSSVGILPFTGGFWRITPTNFIPEIGILDLYWGMNPMGDGSSAFGTDTLAQPVRNSTNFTITTPPHLVTNEAEPFGFPTSIALTNATAFVRTNAVTPTNWLIQAVFVQVSDPELTFDVRFAPGNILTNQYRTAIVEFSNSETNVLDGGNFLTQVYLVDKVAWETNFVLLTNLTTLSTFRPSNYEVRRDTPRGFANMLKSNATNASRLIFNSGYSNTIATNIYSGYSFNITNVVGVIPRVPGASITNLPGRVEIQANELNMNRGRIRGEGIVSLSAKTLTSETSVIDVQNLALDLGASTEPLLVVKSVVKETIDRTTGDIFAWSGVWTNQSGMLVTNTIPDPNNPGGTTNEVATNVIDIGIHVLVVDATRVRTIQPVFVPKFTARSKQVTISDSLRVLEFLSVESESLTLSPTGKLILTNATPNWNRSTFPNLRSLVNEGFIQIPGSADLGTGRSLPYATYINRGTNIAFEHRIRSQIFENSGLILANLGPPPPGIGLINVDAGFAKLEGGRLVAGGPIRVSANDLRVRTTSITTSQAFTFAVTNSVSDGGAGASNVITSEGFHLLRKPRTGDLLGTTFRSIAPSFLDIPHTWAGEDRGPVAAGFRDNMAIGRLVLKGGLDTLYTFVGTSGKNALYVDFLDLQDITPATLANNVQVRPGFTIYFANSSTNAPAEQLNGQLQGRLRWVSGFAGPASSVDVRLRESDKFVKMNSALRSSVTIDSDGDGIMNGSDTTPRDDLDPNGTITLSNVTLGAAPNVITFSWEAIPGKVYVVEYSSGLQPANWKHLLNYTNSFSAVEMAVVQDQVVDQNQRFYRVRLE